MPPTPQPSTPNPLTMVVCESVPTTVSGYARKVPSTTRLITTLAKYSIFTWWTIPVPGGTTLNSSNAVCPQRKKRYLSLFRWYSISTFCSKESLVPKRSAITE